MKKKLLSISLLICSIITNAQCYESLTFGGAHTTAKKADGTLWGWGISQGETGWTRYEVYSLLGQKVAEGKIEVGQNQINISPLTKGIYVLKCSDNSGNEKVFKISK